MATGVNLSGRGFGNSMSASSRSSSALLAAGNGHVRRFNVGLQRIHDMGYDSPRFNSPSACVFFVSVCVFVCVCIYIYKLYLCVCLFCVPYVVSVCVCVVLYVV